MGKNGFNIEDTKCITAEEVEFLLSEPVTTLGVSAINLGIMDLNDKLSVRQPSVTQPEPRDLAPMEVVLEWPRSRSLSEPTMNNDWSPIEFADVPSRAEFEELTLTLLRRGITNSDQMRQEISSCRKLIRRAATGRWNRTPSDKFINEHAWVLEDLVVRRVIEKTTDKEYRLI